MAQTTINIRMDEELKKQAEYLFSEFGMNMTTAFTIFAKAVVRTKKIPFEITADTDPFYNKANMERLKKSMARFDKKKLIVKTIDELEAMEDDQE